MQYRLCAFAPEHVAEPGANSSQIVFLLDLSYQLFRHLCSTSGQYSPSTSFMSAGHADGAGGGAGVALASASAAASAVSVGAGATGGGAATGGGGGGGAGGGAAGSG